MKKKIAETKAESLGIFEERAQLAGTVGGKWAWAFGVYCKIHNITHGDALEAAIKELVQNQGIPWSQYDKKRALLKSKTPPAVAQESQETLENTDPLVPGDSGESTEPIPPALAPETAGEGGGASRPRKPLAEVMAEVKGRPIAKGRKGAA